MTRGKTASGRNDLKFSLADIAARIGGSVEGDGEKLITGVASLKEAGSGDLAFITGSRYSKDLAATNAGAVIAGKELDVHGKDVLRVSNVYLSFAQAIELFYPAEKPPPGVHPTAVVEAGAVVDPSATVTALCFVGREARVGARSVLHPHCTVGPSSRIGCDVVLHPRVTIIGEAVIGNRVIIHSGTVIGSDGFGFVFDGKAHRKIPQVGKVEVGDDVEIGACVTVDRATVGSTRIGRGTKIDNLVQIAHNVEVGENAVIVAQVGVSGSTRIGSGAVLGGQVGIIGHITVGDGARIGAQSGVLRDIPAGETMSGVGPLPHRQWLRAEAAFARLPEMRRQLTELIRRVKMLEEKSRENGLLEG